MHFAALPDLRAAQSPDGPALADEYNGTLTNADLLERVRGAAAVLRQAGVEAGDVVAVKLPNRVELVVALFAAWRLGAAATPINPSLTPVEVEYQLSDSGARILVCDNDDDIAATPGVAVAHLGDLAPTGSPLISSANPPEAAEYSIDALALLVYTSGTTGRPKGVELTHANILAMAESMVTAMDLNPASHSLLILPLFHVNGIVVSVLAPLLAGGQTTIAGRFTPRSFFPLVEKVRPTYFSAVPAIYAMLVALPAEVQPDTSSVRFAVCGAAPMPIELIERFEQRYGIVIAEGYGLSEGTCATTSNPIDGVRKPGTVGPALPGQTVAIMDRDGRLVTDGSTGEVVVKGPTVMRGYLNRPEDTAKTVVDGWLHTGDIGHLDTDGYLTIVDRVKDMIIRGGENIYPKEIESALYSHPAVHEAAVVGRPHPVYGEVPVAFVSYREDGAVEPAALTAHLSGSLAKYKLPADIVAVAEIPKNPVGKIDKPALRRRLLPSN